MLRRSNGQLVLRFTEREMRWLGKIQKAYPSTAGTPIKEWAIKEDAEVETFRVFWDRLVGNRNPTEMVWVQVVTTDEDGREIPANIQYEIPNLIQEFAIQPKLLYIGDTTCFMRFKRDENDYFQYWTIYANADGYEYYMGMREIEQPEMMEICLFFEGAL